jgi:hypothetical protein
MFRSLSYLKCRMVPPHAYYLTFSIHIPISTIMALTTQGKSKQTGYRKNGRPITYPSSTSHAQQRMQYLKSTQIGFTPKPVGRPAKGSSRKQARRKELWHEREILEHLAQSNLLTEPAMKKILIQAIRLPYIRRSCMKLPLGNNPEGEAVITELAQLHENTKQALKIKLLSVAQKYELKKTLTQNSTPEMARKITGDSRWTNWRLTRTPPEYMSAQATYELLDYSVTETADDKETVVDAEKRMHCGFFEKYTGVYSGSDNGVRKMEMPKSTMAFRLYAELPGMYRELSISHPELVQGKSDSRLGKGILEANKRALEPGFNAALEASVRFDMARSRYNAKLLKKRLAKNRDIMPARLPGRAEPMFSELMYEMEDLIFPVADRTFYRTLKKMNVKWQTNAKPYVCPVCLEGPSDAAMLQVVLNEMGTIKAKQKQLHLIGNEPTELEKERLRLKLAHLSSQQQKLDAKQKEYKLHLKQYAVCRPYVDDIIKNLQPGECLVFRDFVNQYGTDGTKIGNLQLVVLYRTKVGGLVRQLKVSNFNRKPTTDWFFVRDVMDFHLKGKLRGGSGLFDEFDRIYISGDHGSHFAAKQNIYFESTIFELYKKTVLLVFLCSYHCYNRCDAAGVYSKQLSIACAREKKVLKESADYAMAMMDDASCDTLGYDFKDINRSLLILEAELKDAYCNLRKMCEFVFFGPGVFKCRRIPGEGMFHFVDIRSTTGDRIEFFCIYCSGVKQAPTYHESEVCPDSVAERFKTEEDSVAANIDMNASPANDLNRKELLKGTQVTKKLQKRMNAEQRFRENPYDCKCCDLKRYKKPTGANKHMRNVHYLASEDSRLYIIAPKKAKVGKSKRDQQPVKLVGGMVEKPVDKTENDRTAVQVSGKIEIEADEPEQEQEADGGIKAVLERSDDEMDTQVEKNGDEAETIAPAEAPVVKRVPLERSQFARSCNQGIGAVLEVSESEGPSESEESSSAGDSDLESDSESQEESDSES